MQYLNTNRGKLPTMGYRLGIAKLPNLSKAANIRPGDEEVHLGSVKSMFLFDMRLKSLSHTIGAIGEIDSATKSFAYNLVANAAMHATQTFRDNSREIKGGFRDSWHHFFRPGKAPAHTGNPFAKRMTFYFGVSAGDKYYKPMGDKGGTIIEWLEYGTKPHNIFLKTAPAFFFHWPPNPRTGSPGSDYIFPIKGTNVFHGLPPTKNYLAHPGIKPYGFIRKTFGEMVSVFEGGVVGPIDRLRFYVGVSWKGSQKGSPAGRVM